MLLAVLMASNMIEQQSNAILNIRNINIQTIHTNKFDSSSIRKIMIC